MGLGRRLVPGVNDLATTHPDLGAEAVFDPTSVSAGSNRKMPWRCAKGHEWDAQPNNRTNGTGCPACSGNRLLPGYNDLATTHPHLAAEALFEPSAVSPGSNTKMPWRCEKGHDWSAVVKNRSLGGTGCSVCANQTVLAGYNDLATTRPDLASEARFDPTTVTSGTSRKLPWTCAKGHDWEATVASRANGAGCAVCSGKAAWPGYNDLATTHPHLEGEALFDLTTVSAGSGRPVPWRCVRGHEWSMSPVHRTNGRQGCPYCANRRVLPGFNDLATTHPDLVEESMFDPTTVTFGSSRRLPWRCAKGHEWEAAVAGRASSGEGCPVCAGKTVIPGDNDLATTHPQLAAEALFDPKTVIAGTHQKLPWRCEKGHEWAATGNSRSDGRGCPICVNKTVLPGYNDLATTHPQLVAEALFDPTTVTLGSSRRLPWRCSLGHEWIAAVAHRAIRRDGCPVCANRVVVPGYNDLATTHPEIAADALFDPTTVTWGSHVRVSWRCQEAHEWKATVKSRALSGTGCPSCAATGYNPTERGWIYLMHHLGWALLQVGITNDIEQRLRVHRRRGWEILDTRGPMDGTLTQAWERSILAYLKATKVPTTPSTAIEEPSRDNAARGPKSGEAWWARDLNVTSVIELMNLIHESEEAAGLMS